MLNWFFNNYEWIFSGIGVAIISGLIAFFRKRAKKGETHKGKTEIHQTNSAYSGTQIGIQNNYYSEGEKDG